MWCESKLCFRKKNIQNVASQYMCWPKLCLWRMFFWLLNFSDGYWIITLMEWGRLWPGHWFQVLAQGINWPFPIRLSDQSGHWMTQTISSSQWTGNGIKSHSSFWTGCFGLYCTCVFKKKARLLRFFCVCVFENTWVHVFLETYNYPPEENKCRVSVPLWKQDYSLWENWKLFSFMLYNVFTFNLSSLIWGGFMCLFIIESNIESASCH